MRTLLLSSALSLSLAFVAPIAAAQDYEANAAELEQSMARAQADAIRPGDEARTCEELETEFSAMMQDPQVQAVVAENGAEAQEQMDRMNAAQGRVRAQMGVGLFMGLASSFVPGLGYAQMAAQQAMAAQQQRQAEQNMAQMMQMAERTNSIMPQLMRGQRVHELAQAKQCAFAQAE